MKKAHDSGKDDLDSVIAVSKKYDSAEAKRKADYKKEPKFTFKEKLYHATLGDPAVPLGQRIAANSLLAIGAVGYIYLTKKYSG